MSNKILIAAVSAILLASTGLASAQTRIHRQATYGYGYAPYANSYYDRSYWDAVAPNIYVRPDPFVGTVWEGVVPY
jgi:opacity protein-like surface antigen